MANSIAKLAILLTADTSGLGKGFANAQGHVQAFSAQIATLAAQIGAIAGAAGAVSWGVKLAAEAETAKVGFEVMLGSAEKAAAMFSDIKKFAAETPFESPELIKSARSLVAFGIASESVIPTLRTLGDIASGLNIPLGELAEIYGKARVQGRLFQEDINQLQGRGIPVVAALAQHFGVLETEIRGMTEQGKIDFPALQKALESMTASGGQFAGMMDRMSQTVSGRWSTLKDQFAELALAIGEKLLPVASRMIDITSSLIETLQGLDATTVENTVKMLAFAAGFSAALIVIPKIVTAIKSLIAMYRAMTIAQSIQQALSGPAGWLTLAASLTIAAGAAYTVGAMFDESNKAIAKTSQEAAKAAKQVEKLNAAATDNGAKEAAEKAAADMKKFADSMDRAGQQLEESLRTPFEKFVDDVREFQSLFDFGAISAETFARAMEKAKGELRDQAKSADDIRNSLRQQYGNTPALQYGTQEAHAAIMNAGNATRVEREAQRQLLAESRKQTELAEKTLKAIQNGEPVTITEVSL